MKEVADFIDPILMCDLHSVFPIMGDNIYFYVIYRGKGEY